MISLNENLVFLALAWLVYFLLHSFLASLGVKKWVAKKNASLVRFYRAGFNVLAVALIVPPLWLMHSFGGDVVWQWTGVGLYFSNALVLFAVLGFVWSMRYYDGMEFLGVRQIANDSSDVEDQEKFCLSPLHRFVRHPWYFFALVIIWSRDMDSAFLVSSICMTLYFIIGSWFEERKLIIYHGETYRRYQSYVPGLLPLPWRYLNKEKLGDVMSQ